MSARERSAGSDGTGLEVRRRAQEVLLGLEQSAPSTRLRNLLHRSSAGLPEREVRFLRALCGETLRWRRRLDHSLRACCNRPLEKLDPPIRAVLRLGSVQILRLSVPDHAAVDTSVRLSRRSGGAGSAGLVNAVLRRLIREGEAPVPSDWPLIRRMSVSGSLPDWMVQRWLERYGPEETEGLIRFINRVPAATLRVTRRSSPEEVAPVLRERGWRVELVPGSPRALRVAGMGITESAPFRMGMVTFQDPVAQLAAPLLGARPGELLLDACAGPGGKGLHLDDLSQGKALVVAAEPSRRSLVELAENRRRLGARRLIPVRTVDCGGLPEGGFHRVLVDAPCSGLGVLNRHPEARWNREIGIIRRMARLQARVLRAAAARLQPGGRLLYVTCSVEPEENEAILESLLTERPDLQRDPLDPERGDPIQPGWVTPAGDLRVLPQRDDLEGYYMARLRRAP